LNCNKIILNSPFEGLNFQLAAIRVDPWSQKVVLYVYMSL